MTSELRKWWEKLLFAAGLLLSLRIAVTIWQRQLWTKDPLFTVLFITGAAIGLAKYGWRLWRRHGSETWPPVQANIESVTVRRNDEVGISFGGPHRSGGWIGELAYSYSVAGEYYSGFYEAPFLSEKNAWDFVDQFKGKTVFVRYKPEDPTFSRVTEIELRQFGDLRT